MNLNDLVSVIATETDRAEFRDLGRRYRVAKQEEEARAPGTPTSAEREAILDEMMERLKWHLRAARYPLPTRQEMEQMVVEAKD